MNLTSAPFRLALLAAALLQAGCAMLDPASGDSVDYRGGSAPAKPRALEVPPDLTQLSRDTRFQAAGGVVSAAAAGAAPAAAGPAGAGAPAVALSRVEDMRIERAGQQRWLVVNQTPEQLWPQVKAFWQERGFTLAAEDAKAGVMETNWAENRAKLPNDVVRNTIGRFLRNAYDTGERDRFRTRLERTTGGTEVYISHRGAEEIAITDTRDTTSWRVRPTDVQLEAEMLARLMVALAGPSAQSASTSSPAAAGRLEPARAAVAAAPEGPARARLLSQDAALEVDDTFDRAWRRVALALDRGGFTVEDRDRSLGLFYVRYVDPRAAGKDEPGWWARLWGDTTNPGAVRYRISVQGSGSKSTVKVLTSSGGADVGENGKRIAAQLLAELR